MKGERKRDRAEDGESGGGGRRKKEVKAAEAPKEEEVEEFFAILRRMHVAVKYFENGNGKSNGDGGKALGEEVLTGIDDVKAGADVVSGVHKNGVLDLNVVPEAES